VESVICNLSANIITYAFFTFSIRGITGPAMLVYLNGRSNTKTAPDENYGRELQELFTVGKGPNSYYTEDDIKAAARVLTGWQFTSDTLTTSFNLSRHDTTSKQFSSFYNSTIITGRNDANAGINDLNDLINMIFAQPETAKSFAENCTNGLSMGREVTTLVDGSYVAGHHEVVFNGNNLPSGIYYYRLQSGNFQQVKPMVLVK